MRPVTYKIEVRPWERSHDGSLFRQAIVDLDGDGHNLWGSQVEIQSPMAGVRFPIRILRLQMESQTAALLHDVAHAIQKHLERSGDD